MINLYEPLQNWLSQPETAMAIDPIIFAVARVIDAIGSGLQTSGLLGVNITEDDIGVVKLITGLAMLSATLLLGRRIIRKKQPHWWPLVALLFVWGAGCVVGSRWVQSIVICKPDEVVYSTPSSSSSSSRNVAPALTGSKGEAAL